MGGEGEDDGELLALISADTGEGNVYSKEVSPDCWKSLDHGQLISCQKFIRV